MTVEGERAGSDARFCYLCAYGIIYFVNKPIALNGNICHANVPVNHFPRFYTY